MEETTILEGCEKENEAISQEMSDLLILPYRYVEPVIFYKKQHGRVVGTVGYKISSRHFRHALLPFDKPERVKDIELYLILLNGECRHVPIRKIFIKRKSLNESFLFVPKE